MRLPAVATFKILPSIMAAMMLAKFNNPMCIVFVYAILCKYILEN